ncbi:MAG: hypothetical protein QMD12_01765 [Candidatus Aenigmarchaeota archaeon]|nr:hypothetical protein [Candidatus Aenigmarchaeota archaeon]
MRNRELVEERSEMMGYLFKKARSVIKSYLKMRSNPERFRNRERKRNCDKDTAIRNCHIIG